MATTGGQQPLPYYPLPRGGAGGAPPTPYPQHPVGQPIIPGGVGGGVAAPAPPTPVDQPEFLSLSSIVTRLVLKISEFALINLPARTLYERQIVQMDDEDGQRAADDGHFLTAPLRTLVDYYKKEQPLRIAGATTLAFTNDLIYGVVASVSYVFCRMIPVALGTAPDIDWQGSSLTAFLAAHSFASTVTYPLYMTSYQVRQNAWAGFSGLIPSGDNMYSKLMSNVFAHLAEMLTLQSIRPFILDNLYLIFGEWLLSVSDGETVGEQIAYQLGIRGVHLLGSILVGLIHLPVTTVVTKLRARPDAYEGIGDCVKKTWRKHGIRGFYGSVFWYILANNQFIMP